MYCIMIDSEKNIINTPRHGATLTSLITQALKQTTSEYESVYIIVTSQSVFFGYDSYVHTRFDDCEGVYDVSKRRVYFTDFRNKKEDVTLEYLDLFPARRRLYLEGLLGDLKAVFTIFASFVDPSGDLIVLAHRDDDWHYKFEKFAEYHQVLFSNDFGSPFLRICLLEWQVPTIDDDDDDGHYIDDDDHSDDLLSIF